MTERPEYTPSKWELRSFYINARISPWEDEREVALVGEEFDRGLEKIKQEVRDELMAEQAKESEAFWEHLIKPTHPEVIAPYETCTYCHSTTGFHHFNCQGNRL